MKDSESPTTAPQAFVPANTHESASGFITQQGTSDEEARYSRPGWSWGGFIFHIYFAACIKRYWYLAWMVALIVPYISGIITLGLMIYFGVKGRELAAASPVFKSKQQYIGFMKGIDHAGKVIFFVFVVGLGGLAIIGILASIVLAGLGSQRDAAREASAMAAARSLVPVMTLCMDEGGSVERLDAQVAGEFICSDSTIVGDIYPELYGGWQYVEVQHTNDSDWFYLVVASDDRAISCTVQGCDYAVGTVTLLGSE